jgi:hypothetical protein
LHGTFRLDSINIKLGVIDVPFNNVNVFFEFLACLVVCTTATEATTSSAARSPTISFISHEGCPQVLELNRPRPDEILGGYAFVYVIEVNRTKID